MISANHRVWFLVGLIGLLSLHYTESSRILGYFPSPSKSHLIIHCSVAETLAQAGHDVTVISNLPNIHKNAKYKYIFIDGPVVDQNFASSVFRKPKPMYQVFPTLIYSMGVLANESLAHPTMQTFLHKHGEGSFDLLILSFFMNDFNLGLAAHFKCPVAFNFMFRPIISLSDFVGNPHEVSYVPLVFTGEQQPMGFLQRVKNFAAHLFENFILQGYLEYKSQIYYDYHFPADRYPPLAELRRNVSLTLVNHHSESQGPIRPNVPAVIEIGGIQIKEQPDPLPEEIQKSIDQAQNGFVYLSLGSMVKGSLLDPFKVKSMFNALSKLPYLVLWKWDEKEVPGIASNIVYKGWLPQDDILAHPKCKLFITHGGQGSVVESEYHGVPMLGIPFFGDQPGNVAQLVKSGFGISIDFKTITDESFQTALNEVLNNPSYSEAVKRFSRLYRDRPMTARQKLVYWTEYVIRHQGANNLQSPAVFLNYWQLHSLDVIAFLLLIVGLFFGTIVVSIKVCCCRRKIQPKKTTESKKNK